MNKHTKYSRAQTLVEFALIIPIMLLLIMVIFDLGRAVYYYNTIHNAAREGARYGVIHPKDADFPTIRTTAVNYAIGVGITAADVWVGRGSEYVAGIANPTIRVTVTYIFQPVTPFFPSIPLTGNAEMRTEALP